ncbi:hypothetical protein [Dongia sp.]|uniref:pPIWI-associating nuclease domain-containing protein n=1 Tax=Dongia sp. TaxID=1977262 RepID=UPI003750134B
MKSERRPRKITLSNPDRDWVVSELDKLIEEWREWQSVVAQIHDQPFDCNIESNVYADGAGNMKRHTILQEKTLTFLDQNIEGHNFIFGFDNDHIDRTDLRLKWRVEHRLEELDVLKACIVNASLSKQVEWVRAAEAVEMLAPIMAEFSAHLRICERAHAGMIRARAELFHEGPRVAHNQDVPRDFWWAEGHGALEQDWAAGDFSTWIRHGSVQLKAFGVTFALTDIQKLLPPSHGVKAEVSARNSSEDNEIIRMLDALVPSAAQSYQQAILDLADDSRVSFRGPALELREALREILDHLAADSEVTSMPGYSHEDGRPAPTMKQKVRFIMKKKANRSSSGVTEQAVTTFEESIALLTRAVYERSSKATHVASERQTVVQLRLYVVAILHEILKA